MMLKYSLFVFCFLLAGYSCVSGHKETKTSAETEITYTDSMCAGLGDTSRSEERRVGKEGRAR